jgi:hypothetical protein
MTMRRPEIRVFLTESGDIRGEQRNAQARTRNFICPITEVECTDSRCKQGFRAREQDEREQAERAEKAKAERMERYFGRFWKLLEDL